MKCESCGMPTEGQYCEYCTDENGNLKPREVVRESMIVLAMQTQDISREEAEKYVDDYMLSMPAWQ